MILPNPMWGNYRLTFETLRGGRVRTYDLLEGEKFTTEGLARALAAQQRKAIATKSSTAEKKKRVAMLEEMAQTFYDDLHGRMESFFHPQPDDKPTRHFAWDRV